VVDDEARRWAEAARSELVASPVACEYEDVHWSRRGHDFSFDASAPRLQGRGAAEACLCFGEQVVSGGFGDCA
jgi:hypothetical protein